MEEARRLMDKKRDIEAELSVHLDYLNAQGVGLDKSLVDAEDFPLPQIDHYAVRNARSRVSVLKNDHRAIMKQIEAALHAIHAASRESSLGSAPVNEPQAARSAAAPVSASVASIAHEQTVSPPEQEVPFLRIEDVASGSPAALAGLVNGDHVLRLGSMTRANYTDLTTVAQLLAHAEGHAVHVEVQRGETRHAVQLIPRPWGGRGLLGCRIVPV